MLSPLLYNKLIPRKESSSFWISLSYQLFSKYFCRLQINSGYSHCSVCLYEFRSAWLLLLLGNFPFTWLSKCRVLFVISLKNISLQITNQKLVFKKKKWHLSHITPSVNFITARETGKWFAWFSSLSPQNALYAGKDSAEQQHEVMMHAVETLLAGSAQQEIFT